MSNINDLLSSYAQRAAETEHEGTSVGYLTYLGLLAQFLTEAYPLIEADVRAKLIVHPYGLKESKDAIDAARKRLGIVPEQAWPQTRTQRVQSDSDPATSYTVSYLVNEADDHYAYSCDCPDYEYRSYTSYHYHCKHIRSITHQD